MRTLVIVSFLVTAGCVKGSPTFGVLDQGAIPRVTFQGQFERTLEVSNLLVPTALEGECDPRVRAIDVVVSSVGLAGKLDVISVGAPRIECTNGGTFATTLKALQDLVPGAVANQTYLVEFRAVTAGGISDPSRLTLTYARALPERTRVTAGGTESVGAGPRLARSTHYRADLRVTNRANAGDASAGGVTATSAHFRLRVGRAGQTGP